MRGALFLVLLLAAVPAVLQDQGWLYFATLILVWCVFVLGYDLMFGLAGLLSFGHAAFFGMGSYVYALIMVKDPTLLPLAMLAAALAGALTALIVGILALRLSGIYFSLMTLAIAELVFFAASSPLRRLTGGEDGLTGVPRPVFLGIDFYNGGNFYLLVLAFFAVALLAARMLRESPFGKVLAGIRLNEIRAEQLGFNIRLNKLAVFAVSGAFSGVAGALLGGLMQFVNTQALHWGTSGDIVMMTLLGGLGTLYGPIIGVIAFEAMKEALSSWTVHWYGILGVIFILVTMFMPHGIHGVLAAITGKVTRRRQR
ncbi:MAG: branched-chain amino acid ABC transporter permease [Lautropia sp.]|nr:branched-chain amino acid ABC transporter permease [Lautropia sp.]